MTASWDLEHFLAYLRSWSATQRYLKDRGADPVTLIEAELRTAWGNGQVPRIIRWDFHVRCGRG